VCLVNARHVKNVPGRRTDVSDCQWLQFLHSVGLLKASYRPEQEVCAVRSLLRHRESLVQMASTHVNHMQKALDQMNLQVHQVISDIVGQTGLAIVDAILDGERDPLKLAKLRNERIKASEEVIAKSLVGDYRPEHLFTLRQSLAAYRSYQKLIDDCDREIRQRLHDFQPSHSPAETPEDEKSSKKARSPDGVLKSELKRAFGIDLTQIPGIRTGIAQTLFGEIGPDFTKFRSASAFASWMGLCPDNDISGGKVLWTGTRKVNCRAATAPAPGSTIAAPQQERPRRFLSPHARQTRRAQSHHRRCPQTRPHHLPPDLHPAGVRRFQIRRRSTPFPETPGDQAPCQSEITGLRTHPYRTGSMCSLEANHPY
jgi:transposase